MRKPEILAPAGSLEALHSAVGAGADAVYLGGSRFGARAYAGNFDENELLEGIRYAHLYGVKVYLTINTLFRNEEIDDLYDYLLPYYIEGLDAVIVQDIGVMEYVHANFPQLPIHASTQMTITTQYTYELLNKYGVTRIVPARELSVDELIHMKENAPELEVFVQGALCVCYSGQCLMSSFIGGRSGNRGRCAGSCRLPYSLSDEQGKSIKTKGDYPLSTTDLCGLNAVPELICAGVDSFKIEGRMKNPEYVAVCVRSYRRCVDYLFDRLKHDSGDTCVFLDNCNSKYDNNDLCTYTDNGKYDTVTEYENSIAHIWELIDKKEYEKLVKECINELAEVFNRDGFTNGYYHKKNGKDMMSTVYPGHMGVELGVIKAINGNRIGIELKKDINKGDIVVIRNRYDEEITLTSNISGKAGSVIMLNSPKTKTLTKGMTVFRRFNYVLNSELSEYNKAIRKNMIIGQASLRKDEPATLCLSTVINGRDISVEYKGAVVERASSKPLSADTIYEKLKQTGNSPFEFSDLELDIDDNIFIPVKELKTLRRNAFEQLEAEILNIGRRDYKSNSYVQLPGKKSCSANELRYGVRILVSDMNQLRTVIAYINNKKEVNIAIDLQYFKKEDIIWLMKSHPEYGYALPMILREPEINELKDLPIKDCNTIIVRNIDELSFLKYIGYKGQIVTDYSMYTMNDMASYFIYSHFPDALLTLPVELNSKQLAGLEYSEHSEWVVYGYQPLMVTAQCFTENTKGCRRGLNEEYILKDRKKQAFYTKAICKYCYNIVYNGVPTVIFDSMDIIKDYHGVKRIHFTRERKEQVIKVLEAFFEGKTYDGEFTRGHLRRGVD